MILDTVLQNAQDTFWHDKYHSQTLRQIMTFQVLQSGIKVNDVVQEAEGQGPEFMNLNIMKPIDPDVKKILGSSIPGARSVYLKERMNLPPEDRYYHPEWSSAEYGWKLWFSPRQHVGFGRQPIIKNSFYRRNGVQRDPDWYREPKKLSPTLCGSI